MATSLSEFSDSIAQLVQGAAASVVAVHGRPRFDSSGLHWAPGVVVTPSHSLQRDEELRVTTPDGQKLRAELAGRDPGTDIAVLRVPDLHMAQLQAAPVESIKPGNLALLAGRNGDTGVIAAMGVVSGVGQSWRTWRGGRLDRFFRLDVSVFAPAVGGAVIDAHGRLIGMATTGLTRLLPVAVPVETISRIAEQLLQTGRISAGYLGVGIQPVSITADLQSQAGAQAGLILLSVQPEGPAAKAGLILGDVLLRLEGKPLESHEDLQEVLSGDAFGKTLHAEVLRAGKLDTIRVVAGERPPRG